MPKSLAPIIVPCTYPNLFFPPQLSDWDRFAAEEYELLVAEEGNTEPMDDMLVTTFVGGRRSQRGLSSILGWNSSKQQKQLKQ